MIRIFLGYDQNETVAYHVLAHSIMRHASVPVSITPLKLSQLPLTRARTPTQSTEFSFSRFLVPWLCGYEGKAIFMDCDMLCRADIAELWDTETHTVVAVVQHEYDPRPGRKFLNNVQTVYPKKNWSSVMLFNNAKCRALTQQLVNTANGLYLHQFKWAETVGKLDHAWNHLVGEYAPNQDVKIAHFTLGGPWFPEYAHCEYAQDWRKEVELMLHRKTIDEYPVQEQERNFA